MPSKFTRVEKAMTSKPTSIDLYWSFRSPYSYLAVKNIRAIEARRDVKFNVKIIMPLAIRDPSFFDSRGTNWLGYVMRDIVRVAQMTDQMIMPPNPDPIVQDMATTEISPDQPYIWRLSRLGVLANDANKGLAFIDEVSRVIWSGENWYDGTILADAVKRASLDLAALESDITEHETELDARIDQHDKDLRKAGHWGVPTCVLNYEPFFGMDRLDVLEWRLDQMGIT